MYWMPAVNRAPRERSEDNLRFTTCPGLGSPEDKACRAHGPKGTQEEPREASTGREVGPCRPGRA